MKTSSWPKLFPPNYVLKQREDAPIIRDNLVAPPVKTIKEEDQAEDKKKNSRGDTTEEEDKKEDKTQADSGQEVAEDDDYLDYSVIIYNSVVIWKTCQLIFQSLHVHYR